MLYNTSRDVVEIREGSQRSKKPASIAAYILPQERPEVLDKFMLYEET